MAEQSAELAGLAALVTSGASGIGLATARLLAARGARVAVLDRVKAAEDLYEPFGAGIYPVIADVTDDAAVRAAVDEATRALASQPRDSQPPGSQPPWSRPPWWASAPWKK